MTGGPGALDPDVLADLRRLSAESGNPAFLTQLANIFLTNAPARLATIGEAVARQDGPTIEAAAHTLRSNCGMLGAMRLSECCRDLEEAGAARAFDRAAALLADAERELALVVDEVRNLAAGD